MVVKTYKCPVCKKIYEIEKDMNDTKEEKCPVCKNVLERVYVFTASHITGGYDGSTEKW